ANLDRRLATEQRTSRVLCRLEGLLAHEQVVSPGHTGNNENKDEDSAKRRKLRTIARCTHVRHSMFFRLEEGRYILEDIHNILRRTLVRLGLARCRDLFENLLLGILPIRDRKYVYVVCFSVVANLVH